MGPLASLLLIIGFAVAVFGSLFVYMMLGVGVGDFQANVFLAAVVGFSAIIGAAWWWFQPPKKEQ
jgi:uncharacterized membrane protein